MRCFVATGMSMLSNPTEKVRDRPTTCAEGTPAVRWASLGRQQVGDRDGQGAQHWGQQRRSLLLSNFAQDLLERRVQSTDVIDHEDPALTEIRRRGRVTDQEGDHTPPLLLHEVGLL